MDKIRELVNWIETRCGSLPASRLSGKEVEEIKAIIESADPWNSGPYKDDPTKPWNDERYRDDPTKPWNSNGATREEY